MERKPISKNLRFEVFKRDKFTCQYCGQAAPDVILEVDHINPVSKGGKNTLTNLVTSCRDCNRGKGSKKLSDDAAVKVQMKNLAEMQERREQLQMIAKWREELELELSVEVDMINNYFTETTKWGFNDAGFANMRKLIKRFGFNLVYKATEIAIDYYYDGSEESWNEAFRKIGGICYNKQKEGEKDAEQDN